MLSYHPALDPYHGALRVLQLLSAAPERVYESDAVRILDFYLLFPFLISKMTLPRDAIMYRREFGKRENRYWFSGEPHLVFQKLQETQRASVELLVSRELLDVGCARKRTLCLSTSANEAPILVFARDINRRDPELVEFLVGTLATLPLLGSSGLKARSGLMEYRYDSV